MDKLRKLLVLVLALLVGVGFVPGVGPVYNLIAVAGEGQGSLPILPVGEELGDEELAAVEGDEAVLALLFWGAVKVAPWIKAAFAGACVGASTVATIDILDGGDFSWRGVGHGAAGGAVGGVMAKGLGIWLH